MRPSLTLLRKLDKPADARQSWSLVAPEPFSPFCLDRGERGLRFPLLRGDVEDFEDRGDDDGDDGAVTPYLSLSSASSAILFSYRFRARNPLMAAPIALAATSLFNLRCLSSIIARS